QIKKEAESEAHALLGLPPTGQRLYEMIQERILEIITSRPSETDRRNILRTFSERCREKSVEKVLNENLRKAQFADIVKQITEMYFEVDLERLQVDFSAIFMDEMTDDSFPKKAARLRKTIVDCEAKAEKTKWMTGDMSIYFREGIIPKNFRGFRVNPHFKANDMGRAIIEAFVTDWRSRASRFEVPVSITGVNISTMPTKTGQIWKKCYDLFRIGDEPKVVMYRSIEADYSKTAPEGAPDDPDIPQAFRKG
ncbi:MAG: hypothetical protein KC931_26240, partial [Candidatus Omnitrophica bacterium]|nr:hypothetical protein [Candidatus Omnitrophota bacterium]